MRVFHVVTGLDSRFKSLDKAVQFLESQDFSPIIPESHTDNEDRTLARLCVAKSIEDCVTGIGVRRVFFRCLEAWDAPSYILDGKEQYPIGIIEIEVPEYRIFSPTPELVPDVEFTHELWIRSSDFQIVNRSIVWIDQFSVDIDDQEENPDNVLIDSVRHVFEYRCLAIRFSETPAADKHHPWLDGMGHTLSSRETESFYGHVGGKYDSAIYDHLALNTYETDSMIMYAESIKGASTDLHGGLDHMNIVQSWGYLLDHFWPSTSTYSLLCLSVGSTACCIAEDLWGSQELSPYAEGMLGFGFSDADVKGFMRETPKVISQLKEYTGPISENLADKLGNALVGQRFIFRDKQPPIGRILEWSDLGDMSSIPLSGEPREVSNQMVLDAIKATVAFADLMLISKKHAELELVLDGIQISAKELGMNLPDWKDISFKEMHFEILKHIRDSLAQLSRHAYYRLNMTSRGYMWINDRTVFRRNYSSFIQPWEADYKRLDDLYPQLFSQEFCQSIAYPDCGKTSLFG